MRVLAVVASLAADHGGPARSMPRLCAALAQQGAQVHLAVGPDTAPRSAEALALSQAGIEVTTLPRGHFAQRRALAAMARAAEVVHVSGLWQGVCHAACGAAHRADKPLVISPRGMLEPWALRQKWLKKRIGLLLYQRRDLRQAALLHATAESEAEQFRTLGFTQPCVVSPNGVDLPTFTEIVPCERRILFVSRIQTKKGLPFLVEAAAVLASQLRADGWELVVAGPDEGGHRAEIERQIAAAGLGDLFCFPGPVEGEAKWKLYASSELFVLPTHSENFGIVVAEALACGVPVITSMGAPWAELRSHGCGWWVDIGTAPLVAALREALSLTSAERMAMGQRGMALVRERYTWAGAAATLLRAFATLRARPQGQAP